MSVYTDQLIAAMSTGNRELRAIFENLAADVEAAKTAAVAAEASARQVADAAQNTIAEVTVTQPITATANGAIAANANFVTLNHASVGIAATIAAPTPGQDLTITQIDVGTVGHTVTLTAGTFDGTNSIATFDAPNETLVLRGLTATRYAIVLNLGSVALSAP